MHTVEPDSAVWCTLRNLTPRYDTHCGVDATVGCTPQSFFEIFCFPDSTVCCKPRTCTPWSFFKIHIQYLGEIETEFENTSSRLSESLRGSNHYTIEVENLVELSILSRQLLVPSSATKYVFTAQETLTLPGGSWVLPYSVCVWGGGGKDLTPLGLVRRQQGFCLLFFPPWILMNLSCQGGGAFKICHPASYIYWRWSIF